MKIRFLVVLLLAAPAVEAQTNEASNSAFCKYATEQAAAQRDLLLAPALVVGPVQPSTGTAPQLVFGVTNSLIADRKAGLTMKVAATTCSLYAAETEAQQHIIFALPLIEKEVLRHRLALIQNASDTLDKMILSEADMVEAQNVTKPAVYFLESAKVRLDLSRTAALTGITSPYVPPLSDTPLNVLLENKLTQERKNQDTTAKLEKQNGWDVNLSAGVHRQISGADVNGTSRTGAYGEFSLTYSFGRHAAEKHYDKAAGAYMDWKKNQFDDVIQQALVLRQQIIETIRIQEDQLKTLQSHDTSVGTTLDSLKDIDTSAAYSFRNQLLADQILLRVEVGDVQFRLSVLHEYLAKNFGE